MHQSLESESTRTAKERTDNKGGSSDTSFIYSVLGALERLVGVPRFSSIVSGHQDDGVVIHIVGLQGSDHLDNDL